MADKEERILISTIPNDVCVHQGQKISMKKGLETICYKKSSGMCNKKRCKIKQFLGMTRQEAINIMAEGMCKRATEAINKMETVVFDFGFYAEAALNALLGVDK